MVRIDQIIGRKAWSAIRCIKTTTPSQWHRDVSESQKARSAIRCIKTKH